MQYEQWNFPVLSAVPQAKPLLHFSWFFTPIGAFGSEKQSCHSGAVPRGPGKSLPVDLRLLQPVSNRAAAARFRRAVVFCEVIADLFTVTLAVTLGYLFYDSLSREKHPLPGEIHLWPGLGARNCDGSDAGTRVGAYRRGNSLLRVRKQNKDDEFPPRLSWSRLR